MKINGSKVLQKDMERFWDRVDICAKKECWEWQGGRQSTDPLHDYGCFWINGKNALAHRLALSFHLGSPIIEKHVMHTCDNPPCCNPHHLKSGTRSDNMQDMIKKGRQRYEKGEERYNSKLTEKKVKKIRELYELHLQYKKYTLTYLAKQYKVDRSLIKRVVCLEAWRHVQ